MNGYAGRHGVRESCGERQHAMGSLANLSTSTICGSSDLRDSSNGAIYLGSATALSFSPRSRLAADLLDLAATVHWLAERSSVSSGATGVERTAVDGAGLTPAAAPQLHAELGELAGDDRAFDHDQAAAVARALAALFPLGGERHEAFADADAGAEHEGLFGLPSRSRIHARLA